MKTIIIAALVALLAGCGGGSGSADTQSPQVNSPLPAPLPAYELIQGSGPLVVLMASDIQGTLHGPVMERIPADLIGAGFGLPALDPPCHGVDATGPAGLELAC